MVGAADEIKGEVPVGFVVLKAGVTRAASDIVPGAGGARARDDRAGGVLQDARPW